PTLPPSLLFLSHGLHLDLHSFPTRRSSDLHFHQGQADSVHRDGPLLHHPPRQPLGHADPKQDGIFMGDARLDDAGSIHVPLDKVDRKSTRLNSSHVKISYAVFCLKKKSTK